MSSFKPMKPSDVNLSNVAFSDMKKLGDHANVVYVNYNKNQFYIKTPELVLPFDSGTMFADQKNEKSGKYSIRASLDNYKTEGHPDNDFYKMLTQLDDIILAEGKKNAFPWFKKKSISDELIKEIYNPMVKFSTDKETGETTDKYPPTFTFKIMQRDDKILCKCYNGNSRVKNDELNVNNKEEEDYKTLDSLLKKKSKVKMLLKCNGVWVVGGKFGCTWKADQIMITPAPGFDECAFLEDSEDEIDEVVTKLDHFVESDSEDESPPKNEEKTEEVVEEDSSDEEPEPEPVKPKKKVRKAKKSA